MKNLKSSAHLVASVAMVAAIQLLGVPVAHAQTTGSVNFTSTLQQIDGFGVAATFGRPAYIQSAAGNLPSQIVDQLFKAHRLAVGKSGRA